MIKLTKYEWVEFTKSTDKSIWPNDAYMDDVCIQYDDGEDVDEDSKRFADAPLGTVLMLVEGWVCNHPKTESLEYIFKAWRKLQTHKVVSVEIEKGFDLKSLLKDTGCKIVK